MQHQGCFCGNVTIDPDDWPDGVDIMVTCQNCPPEVLEDMKQVINHDEFSQTIDEMIEAWEAGTPVRLTRGRWRRLWRFLIGR